MVHFYKVSSCGGGGALVGFEIKLHNSCWMEVFEGAATEQTSCQKDVINQQVEPCSLRQILRIRFLRGLEFELRCFVCSRRKIGAEGQRGGGFIAAASSRVGGSRGRFTEGQNAPTLEGEAGRLQNATGATWIVSLTT